jgi:pimeloyl-ACP methyl ester carboxylesterase
MRSTRAIERMYVNLPSGQMHLREAAGTSPAIVFLHQTASASSSFDAVMQRIRLPNRLIAIDTPG